MNHINNNTAATATETATAAATNDDVNPSDNEEENRTAEERADDEIDYIMNNIIADKSKNRYLCENVKLVLYFYETDNALAGERLLRDELVQDLQNAISAQTTAAKKNKAKRDVVKKWLCLVRKDVDNSPILLEELTFTDVSRYMTSRKKKDSSYLSRSTYDGIRSALAHLYRCAGKEMHESLKKDLKQLMGGIKRTVAKHKKDNGESLIEGKMHMSYDVYDLMCKILSRGQNANNGEYLFAHCYLVLEWNLMARSENVNSCHINHIGWDNDSLLFYFPISKSNQGGENSHVPWHVYSNPFCPHLCPVLTLAKYLFSQTGIISAGELLFPGKHQYDRFIKIFRKVIETHEGEFRQLGIEVGDLGSHSTRKGAITFVSSGCTVPPPPPMASICLRAC
jgi:hypothetical protein